VCGWSRCLLEELIAAARVSSRILSYWKVAKGISPDSQSSRRAWAHVPRPRVRDGTVTSHPRLSKAHGAGETIEIRRTEAAILTMKLDEGQACEPPQAKFLTAAVTGRMKDTLGESHKSIRSSRALKPCGPRRSPVSGIESTGGEFVHAEERLFPHRVRLRHERRRPPPARPEPQDTHGGVHQPSVAEGSWP